MKGHVGYVYVLDILYIRDWTSPRVHVYSRAQKGRTQYAIPTNELLIRKKEKINKKCLSISW